MTQYPLWDGWYKVADPVNKVAGWVTIFLTILWWGLAPFQRTGAYLPTILPVLIPGLICGILSGVFYLLILREKIAIHHLSASTHVWLLVCFVLSLFAGYGGVLIWVQFVMVGILSDIPFWEAFFL